MKTWDVIVIGAGVIGLSIARELQKRGLSVVVLECTEPGREASHAAAGMLVAGGQENPPQLQPLAIASAQIYSEFVQEVEDESGDKIDLRREGTLLVGYPGAAPGSSETLTLQDLQRLEPELAGSSVPVVRIEEKTVDPRALTAGLLKACLHRGVTVSSGQQVVSLNLSDGRVTGVTTQNTTYAAPLVVNCAGAWSGQIYPYHFPVRPVKGQMLAVVCRRKLLKHVLRSSEVYIVPRSDGRILIGATVEEAGYDKRVVPDTIRALHRAAIKIMPSLSEARVVEDWAGLRPGTPDGLPILGTTPTPGYYVATGHFRDGILLTPITAKLMGQVITGESPSLDLGAFSAERFH